MERRRRPDEAMPPFPFSIVIPLYNRANLIGDCLAPFLGPEAQGLEVIVVDDGSSDGSAEVVERLAATSSGAAIRVIRQGNAGPGAARNRGAAVATGRWLAFLDSDDLWMPWAAAALRDVLGQGDPAVVFLAATEFRDRAELDRHAAAPVEMVRHPTILDMLVAPVLPVLGSCNVVVRADVFAALGGFTDEVRCAEDTDLFYRAGDRGEVWSVTAPVLVGYRKSAADSLTRNAAQVRMGARFLLEQCRRGVYPGPAGLRDRAQARGLVFAIRQLFAQGSPAQAYGLLRDGVPLFWRLRDWHHLIRLPLTPVLSLLRPAHYRFRWRPGH